MSADEDFDGLAPSVMDTEFKQSLITSLSKVELERVSVLRKLVYAVGTLPYALTLNIIGFYFNVFLLDVALVEPLYVSAIVFSGRVWDAITDPIIGNLSLRTKTRFGRLRPWLMSAAIPAAIVFFFLWYIPDGGKWDMHYKFIYYFILYLCFQALLTCFHVPYTALIMHVSQDFRERDSATFYRMSTDAFGILLGNVIFAVYIGILSDNGDTCKDGHKLRQGGTDGTAMAYWVGALTISVIFTAAGLTCAIGTKEQKEQQNVNKKVSFFQGLKLTMKFKPYFYLIMMYMFGWVAVNFLQANFSLYVIHALNLQNHFQYVIVTLLASMVLSMQVWQRVLRRFGKKTCLFCGYMFYIPTIISFSMLPMRELDESYHEAWWKITILYIVAVINGWGISGMYLAAWSMLPDVIEESEIPYGVRREELFYAYFVFFTKFGAGITLGISTAILALGKYDVNKCTQNSTTRLTLRLLMCVGPILMMLVSLLFLHFYPITEERRRRTKIELENRKRANNKKGVMIENTPAESSLIAEDTVPFTTGNGHLTEHTTTDSGNYGSVGVTDEMLEVSATDM
ncbi:sodium-dependent lysophosphatidylcholine symporter 1-B-like isoform X2 [Dysidea avara]|uniref:sodium-dependent lysophosphatidylcholine symporter 1-B-like isoform X2 n=1 Tax=Dysidea avara TaxID=196820 RepID=UPI00332F7AFC